MSYPNVQLLIDGQWRDAADGKTMAVFNPSSGENLGNLAHAGQVDLDLALNAAQRGFDIWRNTVPVERAKIMHKAAALLRERADAIALLLTQEQGKPLAEAKGEVLSGADIIDWFAEEGLRVYGRVVAGRHLSVRNLILKEPVGPVAAFTPWNFPINQVVRKLSAALATGCSMIVKAPEETPASPAQLIRAFVDAGIPAGVVGLVYGVPADISSYLIASPVIKKITFTGSTVVGKQLASLAGLHMKRATMELGGHAPVIVCDDADLELAIKQSSAAKFRNAGQVCISPTRFLVHESIQREFAAGFAQYAKGLKVGDGTEPGVQMGPLANGRRVEAMQRFATDAVEQGATALAGGAIASAGSGRGNFFAPTVFSDVPLTAKLFNEEPFGPIAAIRSFKSLDEAIAEANRLPFGLASYAYTKSLKNAHQIVNQLQVGMLWMNQPAAAWPELPFGGVKDSGYGAEGGPEALEAYLNHKTVAMMMV